MGQHEVTPLAHIINASDLLQQQGKIYSAVGFYFAVAQLEPDSEEADKAMRRLVHKAEEFAGKGMMQKAIEIYLKVAADSTRGTEIARDARLGLISLGSQLHTNWQPYRAKAVFSELLERWPRTEEAKEAWHRLDDLARAAWEKRLIAVCGCMQLIYSGFHLHEDLRLQFRPMFIRFLSIHSSENRCIWLAISIRLFLLLHRSVEALAA